jgi:nucleoside phosphorylase
MGIEQRAVGRELDRAGLANIEVIQTGVGKDAIVRVLKRRLGEFDESARDSTRPAVVILAGACGALRPTEDVPRIARIMDLHGHEWVCRHAPPTHNGTPGVTLVAVDGIVSTPADKATLAARTGAAIVDMESHAFAAACEERNVAWHVVRGVSDTPDETLPSEVLGWITPAGDTRAGRAVADMLARPRLVPHIAAVMRRSGRVLPKVGKAVVETIQHFAAAETRHGG